MRLARLNGAQVRAAALVLLVLAAACRDYPTRPPPDAPPITCGNERLDDGELCDGELLNGETCQDVAVPGHPDQHFYRGTLACNSNCLSYNTFGCSGYCGDDTIDLDAPGGRELCDSTNVGDHRCTSIASPNGKPYYGGTLTCSADCRSFDTSGCKGWCGDGVIQRDHQETCDLDNFGPDSCQARGFYEGQLRCTSTCDVDPSDCSGTCGDGIVQSQFGESCDGDATIKTTCQDLGFYGGHLRCTNKCTIDTSDCIGYCGDGNCDTNNGENCKTCAPDCPCGIFGNCGPEGVCICVTKPFTYVDCNNDCGVSETIGVNCLMCGDPSCDVIQPVENGVTWHSYQRPPTEYVQCSTDGSGACIGLSGTMYFSDGCEPFFTTEHLDGCTSDLQECTQAFIDQLQNDGLWPPGRPRFGAEQIHLVQLQEHSMCEPGQGP